MIRCRSCLIPNTRPDTAFVGGECSACINHKMRPEIDWEARHQALLHTIDKADGRVIVPSSGGKDSTYIALRLKELGADVTAVTATTCHLTPIGRANIDNLARHVRTIEVTPNMMVRAKLNRLALEMVGDPSWPEHVSIHRVPFRVARDMRAPALFYGECSNNAYGGPLGTENTSVMTQRWASEFAGFLGVRASDFIGMDGITERDMRDYDAPTDAELVDANVRAHFLGWFEPWDSHRNAQIAMDAGMRCQLPTRANWWTAENQDNAQTGIHDFFGWLKYGYGRLAAQISVDIRNGLISRDEAMTIARERDGLFPLEYMGIPLMETLACVGINSVKFVALCNSFMNRALFVESRVYWGDHLTARASKEMAA